MNKFLSLSENLKRTRTTLGLSLGDVSSLTGVSKTMLSQIESGKSVPTIATAWKIANGLKIRLETLLGTFPESTDIKSIEHMSSLADQDNYIDIYCMFSFSPLHGFEFFYGILKPGCNYCSEGHTNSTAECLMTVGGEIELEIDGKAYTLPAGSAISFDSRKQHKYINRSSQDACAVFIVSYE